MLTLNVGANPGITSETPVTFAGDKHDGLFFFEQAYWYNGLIVGGGSDQGKLLCYVLLVHEPLCTQAIQIITLSTISLPLWQH